MWVPYSRYFYTIAPLPYLSNVVLLLAKLSPTVSAIFLQTVYAVVGISSAVIWYLIAVRPQVDPPAAAGTVRDTISGRAPP